MLRLKVCWCINYVRVKVFKHNIPELIIGNEFPEVIESNSIYLACDEDGYCYLRMKCPCGCRTNINLSLIKGLKPKWSVEPHFNGTISLSPSIWRKKGCGSHFFYKRGKIKWCDNSSIY